MQAQRYCGRLRRLIERTDADDEHEDELPQQSAIFELLVPADDADDHSSITAGHPATRRASPPRAATPWL